MRSSTMTRKIAALSLACGLTLQGCGLDEVKVPESLTGPSELGLSLQMLALPDVVLADGIQTAVIQAVLQDQNGKRVLSFDRAVETQIYNTLPHNLGRLLQAHPLQCPAAFIGGRDSVEMRQVGMAMTQRITQGRVMMLDGSHLFPMEQPLVTAAAMEAALLNLQQIAP